MTIIRKISKKDVENSNGQLSMSDIGKNAEWDIDDCPMADIDEEDLISKYNCKLIEILTDEELYGF